MQPNMRALATVAAAAFATTTPSVARAEPTREPSSPWSVDGELAFVSYLDQPMAGVRAGVGYQVLPLLRIVGDLGGDRVTRFTSRDTSNVWLRVGAALALRHGRAFVDAAVSLRLDPGGTLPGSGRLLQARPVLGLGLDLAVGMHLGHRVDVVLGGGRGGLGSYTDANAIADVEHTLTWNGIGEDEHTVRQEIIVGARVQLDPALRLEVAVPVASMLRYSYAADDPPPDTRTGWNHALIGADFTGAQVAGTLRAGEYLLSARVGVLTQHGTAEPTAGSVATRIGLGAQRSF